MNPKDQRDLGRWHASKDRQEDEHWDYEPEEDSDEE